MKYTYRRFILALLLVPVLGLAQDDDSAQVEVEPNEVVVTASDVPKRVMDAARDAKPSAYIMRITRKLGRDDEFYYVFDASQVNRYWVITVRADGELMRVSEEGEPPVLTKD